MISDRATLDRLLIVQVVTHGFKGYGGVNGMIINGLLGEGYLVFQLLVEFEVFILFI